MIRRAVLAAITAIFATHAAADMTLKIGIDEYDDFFKRCDLSFTPSGADTDYVSVVYRVLVGDKGAAICHHEASSHACRDADDLEYTCEEITRIDVFEASCNDGRDAYDCGKVTVEPDGLSIPVEAAFASGGDADTTRVYATVLGYDDFFDDCEMGFVYTARPEIKSVSLDYDVQVEGGPASCNTTLSGSGGTSRSCSGGIDYTCEAVSGVHITAVTCEDEDGETDCGPVELHAIEQGYFKDTR